MFHDSRRNARQWLRKVSLMLGAEDAVDLSALSFTFDIKRTDAADLNSATIRIYNVSDELGQAALQEYKRVVLSAGYEGNYGIIFDGTIVQARLGSESATSTHLDITALDGDEAYNLAFVNTSLPAGSTLDQHAGEAFRVMSARGVARGHIALDAKSKSKANPRGKVMFALARKVLDDAARTSGSTWNIQNQEIHMYPDQAYLPGEVVQVDYGTGMVGSPKQTEQGIEVQMLLNPGVSPGRLIQLKPETVQLYGMTATKEGAAKAAEVLQKAKLSKQGFYVASVVSHKGATHAKEWYTTAVCEAFDATDDKHRALLP